MSVPKSVVKFDKDGVKFVSSVDYYDYTLKELCRRRQHQEEVSRAAAEQQNSFHPWKTMYSRPISHKEQKLDHQHGE